MSAKRAPAPPPKLAGFTHVDVLGSGGFADVYLYEQQLPRRRVAVKVLLQDRMVPGAAEQFAAEANVMAMLSTHPAIVTIYQAGVSDDGRPYLVMEYCPRPNLQVRSRAAAFSIAEALRVGVQVAAAVETAHRAGILHRDIKPANILVTEYNRPALTDFGIATTAESAESSAGMSIPWSPPESFADDPESGVAADVYALGATVYTLLAGHSPFEQPGGRNGAADLIERIESQPLPPLQRADAPASLQAVLDRSLAKRPGDRYESAVAFARALQRVQIELAHSVTPIDILDDSPLGDEDQEADGELTRVRGIVSIEPQTSPAAGPTRRRDDDLPAATTTSGAVDETMLRAPVGTAPGSATVTRQPVYADDVDTSSTVRRGPSAIAPTAEPGVASAHVGAPPQVETSAGPRSRRGLWIGLSVAAGVIVVAGIALGASLLSPAVDEPSESPSASSNPQDPLVGGGTVPAPGVPEGVVSGGEVTFTWTNPDPQEGDRYIWYPVTLAGEGQAVSVDQPTATLPADAGGTTCIEVQIVRASGTGGEPSRGCTP